MKNDYAFFDAIRANDLETVKSMLAADPALINTPAPKKPADTRGMSPLQAALCTGWHRDIACDLSDTAWFQRIDASGGAVFFAAGVFYYFLKEQVRTLVRQMADAFPGSVLVFDAANGKAVRLMLKTWIKDAAIQNVGAYFAVADARRELSAWDCRLRVSSRGYMLGYNDLKDPSVSGFFRFLARVGDNRMNMQIVKLGFGDGR